ncbi:hypothetical protein PUNSTDRAFT_104368 [Punctularia strigosozonata HHB-11173 SS5]|uniref:uncharacterized protein n=1 Tax=Punctularia strigosozonata (strain HHB-11173) TaxID=741275 RepID=UPI0004416A2F|nr:uncharacterized protein PUNSTDRAFT_104368 [Punctularia strigosozonata HHB-11173 SS5]EIN06948.1 hypothetical protein PUNSTDRAFT_104368 [Punctularia strigosozonata HHB-11173 SS5]
MLKRQSRSLQEAVLEYKRRYGRLPPKGFDHWWDYVQANKVMLPDEYDQIDHDVAHFWAISPKQLRAAQAAHEAHKETYTIGKNRHGYIDILKMSFHENTNHDLYLDGAFQMMEVLEPIEEFIPPFRAVFSPHDGPNLLSSWQMKEEARKAVAQGKYLDLNHLPSLENVGWFTACPPTSPARKGPPRTGNQSRLPPNLAIPNRNRTFIHSHIKAMDPCLHPSIVDTHGEFLPHPIGPPLPDIVFAPQFSYSASLLHGDIRPATPFNYIEDLGENDLTWDQKEATEEGRQGRLLWHGSNTGVYCSDEERCYQSQRQRLVALSENRTGTVALLREPPATSRTSRLWKETRRIATDDHAHWNVTQVPRSTIDDSMMDVHFSGSPMQCDKEMCDELDQKFDWRGSMSLKEASRYKYVMDVDGNGWSSRFKRLITSNAMVLKSSVYPEWFTERILPWVHYVPVQNDYSGLLDIMAFFRGGVNGDAGHDELARKIADAGKVWSQTMWRREDVTAYMFRLMLEYARLMSNNRAEMSYGALV